MHTATRPLVVHASVVLLFRLLLGVPYACAIRRNAAVTAWALATGLFVCTFAYAQSSTSESELLQFKQVWVHSYVDLARGQQDALSDWASTEARKETLVAVISETKKVNAAFESFKPGRELQVQTLVGAIGAYCRAVANLRKAQGAFSEVSYVMSLSDSEAMANYFGKHASDPKLKSQCNADAE